MQETKPEDEDKRLGARDKITPADSKAPAKACACAAQSEPTSVPSDLCLSWGGVIRNDKGLLLAALRLWELKRGVTE